MKLSLLFLCIFCTCRVLSSYGCHVVTPISIFLLVSLLESSNHQDEEHSLIARYAARLAADAAVRYTVYKTFIAHKCEGSAEKPVLDEKRI